MKTTIKYLSIEGEQENILPTVYFNDSNENILKWVQNNLEKFNLNESWSCTVSFFIVNNAIQINGDEDLLMLDITTLKTIQL